MTRSIHDAHLQGESNDRIRRMRWERRAIWDEVERLENEILGIDDSYDDPEGEKEVVTKEEYAAGVKGTGDADVPLDIFEEQLVELAEGEREEPPQTETPPPVVHQVVKGKVAGANKWFLPSGEMIYLEMGDMNPASRRRIGAADQHIIRTATCSLCHKGFDNHRSGKRHMKQDHKAVKVLQDVTIEEVKAPAPRREPGRNKFRGDGNSTSTCGCP